MQSFRETSANMLSVSFGTVIILKANDNDLFTMLGIERVKTTVEVKQNPCEAACMLHGFRNALLNTTRAVRVNNLRWKTKAHHRCAHTVRV